mmetsp:Transcript_21993/g.48034  ORF Transcript_21993/g.48034 Transcript_21993/m.48034 type:complete len:98 (-) Transcript_21993:594-887(-)
MLSCCMAPLCEGFDGDANMEAVRLGAGDEIVVEDDDGWCEERLGGLPGGRTSSPGRARPETVVPPLERRGSRPGCSRWCHILAKFAKRRGVNLEPAE